jgi:hypothetical protein
MCQNVGTGPGHQDVGGPPDLDQILNLTAAALRPGSTLLAVPWRHPVAEHPRSGDNVRAALGARPEPTKLAEHIEPDFRAEAYWLAGTSLGRGRRGMQPGRLGGHWETGERHPAPVLGPARLGRRDSTLERKEPGWRRPHVTLAAVSGRA